MVIMYRVPGEYASVTEICDVTRIGSEVYFTPTYCQFKTIKINNIDEETYKNILHNLFYTHKADLTPFSAHTSYDESDDEDKDD